MRSLLFAPCVIFVTLFYSSLCWLFARVGKDGRLSHRLECLWGKSVLRLAGVRVDADLSALTPGEAYVFMANHQSHMDIPILFATLAAHNFRFLAKDSLFAIPLFGPAMRRVGHIAILRENSRKAMRSIDEAVAAAGRGISVLIFPEGTRSLDPSALGDFKIGGMIMALKCGHPVAPVIITGSAPILPKGKLLPRAGLVRVAALEPFDPTDRFTLKQREAFRVWLHERMDREYKERGR